MDRFEAVVVVVDDDDVLITWKERERENRERNKRDELSINGFSVVSQQKSNTSLFGREKRRRGMKFRTSLQPQSSTHGNQENELTLMS